MLHFTVTVRYLKKKFVHKFTEQLRMIEKHWCAWQRMIGESFIATNNYFYSANKSYWSVGEYSGSFNGGTFVILSFFFCSCEQWKLFYNETDVTDTNFSFRFNSDSLMPYNKSQFMIHQASIQEPFWYLRHRRRSAQQPSIRSFCQYLLHHIQHIFYRRNHRRPFVCSQHVCCKWKLKLMTKW